MMLCNRGGNTSYSPRVVRVAKQVLPLKLHCIQSSTVLLRTYNTHPSILYHTIPTISRTPPNSIHIHTQNSLEHPRIDSGVGSGFEAGQPHFPLLSISSLPGVEVDFPSPFYLSFQLQLPPRVNKDRKDKNYIPA